MTNKIEDYYDATTGDISIAEVDMSKLEGFTFVRGAGSLENKQACLFTAASVLGGYAWTDRIPCVCPVITNFGIRLSDSWHDDTDREAFVRKYAPLVLNTRSTHEVERKRANLLVRAARAVFAPLALDHASDALERSGYTEHARKLRYFAARLRVEPSAELARGARAAASAATDARAAYAAYAAMAARAASAYAVGASAYDADASAADAADDAAYAAASAYDAAADAARAATASDAAADAYEARKKARAEARRGVRAVLLQLFDDVIAIKGPQS